MWLTVRLVTVMSVLLGVTSAVEAQSPTIGGGALRGPYWSPPGWFGPGPAWHHWSDPGPGNGWQYYGIDEGPYINSPPYRWGGPGWWPGYWGIPGAAGSFWTNGLSLYGPPTPSYGPTPGVFSGGDSGKLFFRNPPPANAVWIGLGWGGYRSPWPYHGARNVSVYPAPDTGPSVQVKPGENAFTPDGAPCLRLSVRLPEPNADVWIEKIEMRQKGIERTFESPPLEAGKNYRYDIVARWTENGRDKAESRTVTGQAGQSIQIDFTKPADEPAVVQK